MGRGRWMHLASAHRQEEAPALLTVPAVLGSLFFDIAPLRVWYVRRVSIVRDAH